MKGQDTSTYLGAPPTQSACVRITNMLDEPGSQTVSDNGEVTCEEHSATDRAYRSNLAAGWILPLRHSAALRHRSVSYPGTFRVVRNHHE